jgi:hypothetical protein
MGNERNSHRIAVVLFAIAVVVATVLASITTLERAETRIANNETPPGTMGVAKSHAPLDRSPGHPALGK